MWLLLVALILLRYALRDSMTTCLIFLRAGIYSVSFV